MSDILAFSAGYGLILTVPGPNAILVASCAALVGLRRSLPLGFGLAAGAAVGALATMFAGALVTSVGMPDTLLRVAAGALLVYVGWRIGGRCLGLCAGRSRAATSAANDAIPGFACGLVTAACNPITLSYFASQFVGVGLMPSLIGVALIAAGGAFLKWAVIGHLFSRRRVREAVLAYEVHIRRALGMLFMGFGAKSVAGPALRSVALLLA